MPRLILASASPARRRLLAAAGVDFGTHPAGVDEGALKTAMLRDGASPTEIAERLAETKARRISASNPGALVLGADQILTMDGEILSKPNDLAEARAQLERLSGRTHRLIAALCVVETGRPVWRDRDEVELTVRRLSRGFLDAYLDAAGQDVLTSVGCYRLEGLGIQLFSAIEGDYFTVLGLPLLPLLVFLRDRGVLVS